MSTKKYNAAWLLFILAIILACTDARGQVANVQINPNTGVLKSPATGAFPGIQPSQSVTRTTDANYSVPVGVSLIEWNATTQSAQRSITLPDITPVANGSIPAGSLITVKIVSANSQNVNVLDFDANSLVIITTGALYQFRAEADGDWQATNMSFGTAAYVNTGTSGGTIPLLNGANAWGANQQFGDFQLLFGTGRYISKYPAFDGFRMQIVGGGFGFFGDPGNGDWTFQAAPTSAADEVTFRAVFSAGLAINTGEDVPVRLTPNNTEVLNATDDRVTFKGTSTNDSAAAGWAGEVISSTVTSGSAVSLTTGTSANVTSISLTAGDYDISGSVYFVQGASTLSTYYTGGIGAVSATLPGYAGAQESIPGTAAVITGYDPSVGIPPTRVSIASTTTYYLVAQSAFTISTNAAYGHLRARRMR